MRTEDGAGHRVDYGYNSGFHALVTSETRQVDQNPANNLVSTISYNDPQHANFDLAFGLPYQATDVNGKVTTYDYDSLGRVVSVRTTLGAGDADGISEYVDYDSNTGVPRHVINKQCAQANGACSDYLTTWTFFDGLGRTIQQQTESEEPGKRIVQNWKYEHGDKRVIESIPYETNASSGI